MYVYKITASLRKILFLWTCIATSLYFVLCGPILSLVKHLDLEKVVPWPFPMNFRDDHNSIDLFYIEESTFLIEAKVIFLVPSYILMSRKNDFTEYFYPYTWAWKIPLINDFYRYTAVWQFFTIFFLQNMRKERMLLHKKKEFLNFSKVYTNRIFYSKFLNLSGVTIPTIPICLHKFSSRYKCCT